MIFDNKHRVIGKIVSIDTHHCSVMLRSDIENFIANGFDDIHRFAQINSYVVIPYQNEYIVAEVIGIGEKGNNADYETKHKIEVSNTIQIVLIGKLLRTKDATGITRDEFKYGISVYPPLYSDVLYIQDNELDAIFQNKREIITDEGGNKKHEQLNIGTSTVFPDYSVCVDINSFFGKHSAILGNTGSGKSCTISSVLQSLFQYKNFSAKGSSFIIFDTNGEYLRAFSGIQNEDITIKYFSPDFKDTELAKEEYKNAIQENKIFVENFKLPHWFLNFDEWALLLQASEKVQIPILRNALSIAQIFTQQKIEINKIKNHILATAIINILNRPDSSGGSKMQEIRANLLTFHTPDINIQTLKTLNITDHFGEIPNQEVLQKKCEGLLENDLVLPTYKNIPFNLSELEKAFDLAIMLDQSHGSTQVRNFCASLITRIKDLYTRTSDFNFLKTDDDTLPQKSILKYFGLEQNNENYKITKKEQIIIIDLSSVQQEGADIITSVLSRIIFETLQKTTPRNGFPVNIIIEEAHRYIAEHDNEKKFRAQKIFERIAKEGRKFGISLMVSSQRPSELSKTVLSQCSNFIVHRIMNPDDLRYVGSVAPYISKAILDQLPYIQTQHALIFGDAINIPMTFKVNEANPRPKSDNNEITNNWFIDGNKDFNELFLSTVCTQAETENPQCEKREEFETSSGEVSQESKKQDIPEVNYESEIRPEDLPF